MRPQDSQTARYGECAKRAVLFFIRFFFTEQLPRLHVASVSSLR
jgi:hypothetical protein